MALRGQLKIGGRTYGVIHCTYTFSQSCDPTGKPSGRPDGGTITFKIPSPNDDDMLFYNWMFHKSEVKSGIFRFRIYTSDNKICYKTLSFANAYCIGLTESFDDYEGKLMYTTVTISAQLMRFGAVNNSTFFKPWNNSLAQTLMNNLGQHLEDTIADAINPF